VVSWLPVFFLFCACFYLMNGRRKRNPVALLRTPTARERSLLAHEHSVQVRASGVLQALCLLRSPLCVSVSNGGLPAEESDNFIEAKATKAAVLLYFVYKAPFIIVNMVPPAVLISVIILFTSMKKKNELTALRTSGAQSFHASQTMILGRCSSVVGMFLVSETVVPYTSSKATASGTWDVQKQDPGLFYGKEEIWYRGGNAIYWIRQFNPKEKTMGNPSFYFFDNEFRCG